MVKAFVFDWDGTLVNTLELTYSVYNDVFALLGKRKVSFRNFKRLFGRDHGPLYDFVGLSQKERKKVDELWIDAYKKRQREIKLYPHVVPFLQGLKNSGAKIGLVSSGKAWRVGQELEILGLKDFFDAVVTVEQISNPKPHPEGLLVATKSLGVKPSECLYVGDMQEDVLAGKRARMKTAIVLHGMHGRQALAKLKPDFVFRSFRAIPKPLQQTPRMITRPKTGVRRRRLK